MQCAACHGEWGWIGRIKKRFKWGRYSQSTTVQPHGKEHTSPAVIPGSSPNSILTTSQIGQPAQTPETPPKRKVHFQLPKSPANSDLDPYANRNVDLVSLEVRKGRETTVPLIIERALAQLLRDPAIISDIYQEYLPENSAMNEHITATRQEILDGVNVADDMLTYVYLLLIRTIANFEPPFLEANVFNAMVNYVGKGYDFECILSKSIQLIKFFFI